MDMIPAYLLIDIEPDAVESRPGEGRWSGFLSLTERVQRLRDLLAERTGRAPTFSWFLRLDPGIAAAFGRADDVVERHGDALVRLVAAGDALGVHMHPYRVDPESGRTVTEHADEAWIAACLDGAFETFAARFGEPVRRYRGGGYLLLPPDLLDRIEAAGVRVDCTVEPGLAPSSRDPSFGSEATAPSTDFRSFPRHAYFADRRDAALPARSAAEARRMLTLPLSSVDDVARRLGPARRFIRKSLGRARHRPLSMWRWWGPPGGYWDLAWEAATSVDPPLFAMSVRTDDPASVTALRVARILDALADHPIGARLRFGDPAEPSLRAAVAQRQFAGGDAPDAP